MPQLAPINNEWYGSGGGYGTPGTPAENPGNDLGAMFGMAGEAPPVYFGGDPLAAAKATQYYTGMANQTAGNAAPQANGAANQLAQANYSGTNNYKNVAQGANVTAANQQWSALGNLAQAASGKGPSAAQAQLQQGVDAGINANMAMANSARGQAGLANAQKNAMTTNGAMMQGAANQAAQLRAQEMQQAQGAYMGAANQMQNQYAQQAQGWNAQGLQNLGMQNQFYQGNAQLQAGQNALNQQGSLAYQQLGFNAQAEALQAAEANQQASNQVNQANAKGVSSGIGGLVGAAGGALAMFSDERVKSGVRDGGIDIDDALGKMQPSAFHYADMRFGAPGEHTGVMAQDLASSEAGRRMVVKDPQTKALAVKIPEAASFLLGATARLHERLSKLEGGTRIGESHFDEPGGGSKWTLREEPDFILAKNDRTGEARKLATEPLSPKDAAAARSPHGAGPISFNADGMLGGLLGGGGGDSSGDVQAAPPVQGTSANAAINPALMNAVSNPYQGYNPSVATFGASGGSQARSNGSPQNIGQGIMSAEKSYSGALDSAASSGSFMAGGI